MWHDAKALSAIAMTLASMAIVGVAAAAVYALARHPLFAITEVVVTTPLERASAPHLEALVRERLAGTFFTMDLERSRRSLASLPWVRSVALRRQWPHTVEITIEEHAPLARFGDALLVNTHGETFAATAASDLPRFVGPGGTAAEMTTRYREWSQLLKPLGIAIAELHLSDRGGWRVRTTSADGSIVLDLGREDATGRLARFTRAYARTLGALAQRGTRIESVDLRYRNGFAARVPGFRESGSAKRAS
ncbi:MAG TPA: cell division protein FtsQ/DivIB [Casimicrobiaceae bacterium]|nr:cell division protein FtsQ/DivIB [Casimicrobiaceae bacterium]